MVSMLFCPRKGIFTKRYGASLLMAICLANEPLCNLVEGGSFDASSVGWDATNGAGGQQAFPPRGGGDVSSGLAPRGGLRSETKYVPQLDYLQNNLGTLGFPGSYDGGAAGTHALNADGLGTRDPGFPTFPLEGAQFGMNLGGMDARNGIDPSQMNAGTFETNLSQGGSTSSYGVHIDQQTRASMSADVLMQFLQPSSADMDPVSDTSKPVGFHQSTTGYYVSPRFMPSVAHMRSPGKHMLQSCILDVPASQLTNGFSQNLRSGSVQAYVNPHDQLIKYVATSYPRFTSKSPARVAVVLVERARGKRNTYEIVVDAPQGCVVLLNDPYAAMWINGSGDYIEGVKLRLSPEVYATYNPSAAPVPASLMNQLNSLKAGENFRRVGHCIYIASFAAPAENIQVMASLRHVVVKARLSGVEESLTLEIPLACLPQFLHRTNLWVVPSISGSAVIAAFSPPPPPSKSDGRWRMVPSTHEISDAFGQRN